MCRRSRQFMRRSVDCRTPDTENKLDKLNSVSIIYVFKFQMADLNSSLTAIDWLAGLPVRQVASSAALEEPVSKPPHSYAWLICEAISSTTTQMMTLSEIYTWIQLKFPYFRRHGTGWKNSVRHNLSINKQFRKVPRSKDDPGKGHYWAVDPEYYQRTVGGGRSQTHKLRDRCSSTTVSGNNDTSVVFDIKVMCIIISDFLSTANILTVAPR